MNTVGSLVWVPDSLDVWVTGQILSVDNVNAGNLSDEAAADEMAKVRIEHSGEHRQFLSSEMFPRNADGRDGFDQMGDLIQLPHLHEPAILHAVLQRAREGSIYTYTGPILLAVNPFKPLSLYSHESIQIYRDNGSVRAVYPGCGRALPPHIFALTDTAFRSMLRGIEARVLREGIEHINQSILVSGESGAGKTGRPACNLRSIWIPLK